MLGLHSVVVEVLARSVLSSQRLLAEFAARHGLPDPTRPSGGGAAITLPKGKQAQQAQAQAQVQAADSTGAMATPALSRHTSYSDSESPRGRTQLEALALHGQLPTSFVDTFDNSVNDRSSGDSPSGSGNGPGRSGSSSSADSEGIQLQHVAERMCGLRGLDPVPIADRKWRLQSYTGCWIGHEAVQWLQHNGVAHHDLHAVAIGNRLVRTRLAVKVDGGALIFHDAPLFYRFTGELRWPLVVLSEARDTQLQPQSHAHVASSRSARPESATDQERQLFTLLLAELPRLNLAGLDLARMLYDMMADYGYSSSPEALHRGASQSGHSAYATTLVGGSPSVTARGSTPSPGPSSSPTHSAASTPGLARQPSLTATTTSNLGSSSPRSSPPSPSALLHDALRRTGHFQGCELVRHLKRIRVAHSTRDAMILATYLLKLPAQLPSALPPHTVGVFALAGMEEELSEDVIHRVMQLDADLASSMRGGGGDKDKENETPAPTLTKGVSIERSLSPLTRHGTSLDSPRSSSSSTHASSEGHLDRRPSLERDTGLISPSHRRLSSLGQTHHGGGSSSSLNRPAGEQLLLSIQEKALLPSASAMAAAAGYHAFLLSVEHLSSMPFCLRDTFKNAAGVWYKLMMPPPPPVADASAAEQAQTVLPGSSMSADVSHASAAAASRPLVPPLRMGAALLSDAALEQGLPTLVRQHYSRAKVALELGPTGLQAAHAATAAAAAAGASVSSPKDAASASASAAAASCLSVDAAAHACAGRELQWQFVQSFGDDHAVYDESEGAPYVDELLTAVTFHPSGAFLAIGDQGGHISVMRELPPSSPGACVHYDLHTDFEAHWKDFDSLRSTAVEPEIVALEWWKQGGSGAGEGFAGVDANQSSLHLLSANERVVKLWRVGGGRADASGAAPRARGHKPSMAEFLDSRGDHEGATAWEAQRRAAPASSHGAGSASTNHGAPSSLVVDADPDPVGAVCRAMFSHCPADRAYIHSVDVNSDGRTFLSSDDHVVNLWDVEARPSRHDGRGPEPYVIFDLTNREAGDGAELLTVARFHPSQCHLVLLATTLGVVHLCDLRARARPVRAEALRMCVADSAPHGDCSGLIDGVHDARFSACGRYILARDQLTLRVWDTYRPHAPMHTVHVHPSLGRPSFLAHALSVDPPPAFLFDSFQCAFSPDALHLVSGTYSNAFTLHNVLTRRSVTIEARDTQPTPCVLSEHRTTAQGDIRHVQTQHAAHPDAAPAGTSDSFDPTTQFSRAEPVPRFTPRMMKVAWHPRLNAVAVAGLYRLYLYQARP